MQHSLNLLEPLNLWAYAKCEWFTYNGLFLPLLYSFKIYSKCNLPPSIFAAWSWIYFFICMKLLLDILTPKIYTFMSYMLSIIKSSFHIYSICVCFNVRSFVLSQLKPYDFFLLVWIFKMCCISISQLFTQWLTDSPLRYPQDVTSSQSENIEPVPTVLYAFGLFNPYSHQLLTPPQPPPSPPAKIKDASFNSPLRFWHSGSAIPFNPYPLLSSPAGTPLILPRSPSTFHTLFNCPCLPKFSQPLLVP